MLIVLVFFGWIVRWWFPFAVYIIIDLCYCTFTVNSLIKFGDVRCVDILKRTDSSQPDYMQLKKAIAALEEVMTLVANSWCIVYLHGVIVSLRETLFINSVHVWKEMKNYACLCVVKFQAASFLLAITCYA